MQTKKSETVANDIDLAIFRALERVEGMIDADQLHRNKWHEAARYLRSARGEVRSMMSRKDRETTNRS